MNHHKLLMCIAGLTLAGGASFLYVKRVLTDRRRRLYEEEDRLREQSNAHTQEIIQRRP
ncbi:hypothetical protein PAXRUDRAFT_823015 [Paxillus rubicundulus Ve08.2h10]|uniref:Uncharacterized protein n=1 Tax=Paxillus rubicundulus Ve08.2h10 TaxID=930991 RepID=A0A0D0ECD6_9AGAM|nr:hypothetical protein PAXRUDRAFT_823015 [Paxillus rubicundulus Ve08.2h10]